MGKRGRKPLLDDVALHRFLWARSDSHHRIVVNQRTLANELAVSHDLISLTLIGMKKRGLLTESQQKLEKNVKQYIVTPPEDAGEKLTQRRVPAWG